MATSTFTQLLNFETIQYNTTLLSLCREICLCILVLMDRMQKCSYLTLNRKVMYAGTYGQSAEM